MEKLWTTAEVAQFLSVTEGDVEELVRSGKLTGYKLGGRFVRFRPEQVKSLKTQVTPRTSSTDLLQPPPESWQAKIRDFVYFYDFYILSCALLAVLAAYLICSS